MDKRPNKDEYYKKPARSFVDSSIDLNVNIQNVTNMNDFADLFLVTSGGTARAAESTVTGPPSGGCVPSACWTSPCTQGQIWHGLH